MIRGLEMEKGEMEEQCGKHSKIVKFVMSKEVTWRRQVGAKW